MQTKTAIRGDVTYFDGFRTVTSGFSMGTAESFANYLENTIGYNNIQEIKFHQ